MQAVDNNELTGGKHAHSGHTQKPVVERAGCLCGHDRQQRRRDCVRVQLVHIAKRSITKAEIKEIYTLGWLNDARPLVLIGQAGVGKTFIAQAIGLHACASGKSVLYMSITALLENLWGLWSCDVPRSCGEDWRQRCNSRHPAGWSWFFPIRLHLGAIFPHTMARQS
jgi:hypothetical protein